MSLLLKDKKLEADVKKIHHNLVEKDKQKPNTTLEKLNYLEVETREYKPKSKLEYTKKQCSPGDLLVSSAWRTY